MEVCIVRILLEKLVKTLNVVTQIFDRFVYRIGLS